MVKSCAEATIELLSKYGVTTIFGIPGVHTLDFCRALTDEADDPYKIRHIQARNEQGAGFMAEGWARATGDVGVALVYEFAAICMSTTPELNDPVVSYTNKLPSEVLPDINPILPFATTVPPEFNATI